MNTSLLRRLISRTASLIKPLEIYKKADGKPESNDFVPSEKAAHLALMLQDLIASFDFEDKQAKHSKKAYN